MTMHPWLARPLRRFLGTMAMLVGGQAVLHDIVHASPELPPPTVDRVEVVTMGGSRAITDRATVDRIVALVRGRTRESMRFPGTVCLLGTPRAEFYQDAAPRGEIILGVRVIAVPARDERVMMDLSERDAAELYRLLALPRPSPEP